jgi:hypothetical protein
MYYSSVVDVLFCLFCLSTPCLLYNLYAPILPMVCLLCLGGMEEGGATFPSAGGWEILYAISWRLLCVTIIYLDTVTTMLLTRPGLLI